MALSYDTIYAMPRLMTYADADRRERETKPIRGDEHQRKPLGRRNQKYRHIKREADNSITIHTHGWRAESYPLIQFYPNGEIHVLGYPYWNKAAENEVISRVLGVPVQTEQRKSWLSCASGEVPLNEAPRLVYSQSTQQWVASNEKPNPNIFVRDERGYLVCTNLPILTTHVVSRKGANQVRARYEAGINYVRALAKLRRDNEPKWEEVAEAFPERMSGIDSKYYWQRRDALPATTDSQRFKHEHAEAIATLLASPEPGDQYKAYLWLGRDVGARGIDKSIDRVLTMVHHDEWLVKREVPAGMKRHDRYVWAFPPQKG